MKPLLRVMPLLLAATALSSCAALQAEDEASSPYGAFLAARYAGVNRDAQTAAGYYAEALDRAPGDATLTDRAFITAVIAGDVQEASRHAETTVAAGDPSRLATLYLAADLMAKGQHRRAHRVLESAPDFGPFNTFLGELLSQWTLMGLGRPEDALAGAEDVMAPGFLASHLWLHKALLHDAAGDATAADEAYRTAMLSSTFPRLTTELYGEFLEREGRRADARTLYQIHLENSSGEASVQMALDRVTSNGRPPRRPTTAQMAALALFGPSASLAANANMDLTVVYLRMVQRLYPDYDPIHLTLGETLQRIRLPEAALREYAAVEDGPYRLAAQIDRIWLIGRLSRLEEATEIARGLVEQTGESEARLILADLLRVQSQCPEAAGIYRRVIEDRRAAGQPDDWRYHYYRAVCLVEADDWPAAEAEYLAALELAPAEARILNDLGYLWIERGERIEQAFEMIVQAAELDPDNGNIIDSLGWAHYQLGNYELAVQTLESAAELQPGNVAANLHLGDAYWRVGRYLEAGFQWRRSLDLEPRPEQLEALQYRLRHGRPPAGESTYAETRSEAMRAGEP